MTNYYDTYVPISRCLSQVPHCTIHPPERRKQIPPSRAGHPDVVPHHLLCLFFLFSDDTVVSLSLSLCLQYLQKPLVADTVSVSNNMAPGHYINK